MGFVSRVPRQLDCAELSGSRRSRNRSSGIENVSVLPITILPGAIGREVLSLCEMLLRLRAVGLTNGDAYELPITQNELADTLGMSGVHMNRVIMNLRAEKLIRLKTKKLTILDVEKLKAFSGFNPNYLYYASINALKQPSP